jgi:bifunctional DNase/RNase
VNDIEATGQSGEYLDFRVMQIETLEFDLTKSSPTLKLIEAETPFRQLGIPIALPEATALQLAIQGKNGRRPGTHELITTILTSLQTEVICARLMRREQGVYFAEVDLMTSKGRQTYDARVSDAVILAQRQKVPAPILCNVELLAG